ncbi:MAG: hypothetical protein WBG57_14595 [Ornithinimicrobium sp.]
MWAIAFAALFGWAVGAAVLSFLSGRAVPQGALVNSLVYGCVLTTLAAINFEFQILEQKLASDYAYQVFKGAADYDNFAMVAVVNAVPFALTDVWWAAIGTNIAVLAIVKAYLYATSPRLSMLMWAPAVVNFGLFALRDPLIGLCFMVLTLFLCQTPTGLLGHAREIFWLAASTLLRPETLVIYAGARVAGLRSRIRRQPWILFLLPFIAAVLVYGVSYLPVLLGLKGQAGLLSLPSVLQEFFVARAERNTNVGEPSDILGGRLASLPFLVRYPIQILAFFILPFPFEITTVPLALAFLDSVVFVAVAVVFWRRAPKPAKTLFVIFVLATAFFADNYGNLLRLRLPAYFIFSAGLLVSAKAERAERSIEKQKTAEGIDNI